MSDSAKAVFLSYASQDAEAAKRICEALRAAGVEVWFDQSELVGGDQWDGKIRGQISSCALFLPIISANTQARLEGYFRLEWKLAAQRTHTMADEKTFLLPVVIDGTRDAEAKVPAEFKGVQWTKLIGGETPPAFCERVKRLLAGDVGRDLRIPPVAEKAGFGDPALHKPSPRWLAPVIAGGVIAVLALVLARPWERTAPPVEPSARRSAPTTSESTAPVSEARQLARRAFAPVEHGSPSREQLVAAEALCDHALALDGTDPEIWTIAARIDVRFIQGNFDTSATRRERAISRAARVIGLAPDLFESRLTRAYVLDSVATTDAMRADAESQLLALLKERPDDSTTLALLANLARKAGRFAASGEYYDRSGSPGGAAWSYYFGEDFVRAAEATERSLRKGPSPAMTTLKALLAEVQREDVEAARAIFREIPASALLEEGPAYSAVRFAWLARRPDEVIQVLGGLPTDYLSSAGFSGPKALLTGKAHELAGRPEAARADWQLALGVMGKKLALTPNDPKLLLEKAEVLAWLGDTPEAEKTLRLAAQLAGTAPDEITVRTLPIHLRLGHRDDVLAYLTRSLAARENGWRVMHAMARFDPDFDPLRGDPRFEKLLRDHLPEGAKPFEDPKAKTPDPGPSDRSLVDQKSVAVLAFANLSDDKGNEYFSDGISEELLNVLAKVPGLKVSARTSAFYFKGKEVPIPEIAQKLGVAYVVEGSVRKQGDKVRITAQLIKAADGFHVWSDTFTRDLKDIFAVQDEIAGLIAQNLKLSMGLAVPAVRRAVNPEAHQLVLEGRHFWNLRTIDGFARAEAAFTKALQLDPQFAQAYAGLADVHWVRTVFASYAGENYVPAKTGEMARRAIELDPALAEAYPASGGALQWAGRFPEAVAVFKKAIALNPNYMLGHHWYALVLESQGRLDEALAEIERAIELDPFSPAAHATRHRFLLMAGRISAALEADEKAVGLRPSFFFNSGLRAQGFLAAGRREEALAAARFILVHEDLQFRYVSDVSAIFVLRALGHEAEAATHAGKMLSRLPAGSFMRGLVLAASDRWDEARPYLERTPRGMSEIFFWNPAWDRWRDDPRFLGLMEKLGCMAEYQVARATLARMRAEQEGK